MRYDKTKNEKGKRKRAMVIGFLVCLVIALGTGVYLWHKATNYQHVTIQKSDKALGITSSQSKSQTEEETAKRNDIVNIALFGVDRREKGERGRSDAMMIATVDFKHDKLKLTSLMRDMYVPIEGHGNDKLNSAYAFGGAELAIKTINQNFGTDIRDYVTVDFFTLEKIIDSLGGVMIEVKPEEVAMLNDQMKETARIEKKPIIPVSTAGYQQLNGMQAVSYSRIRHVGNGDFERTERQRLVLASLMETVKQQGKSAIPQLLFDVTPELETSLSQSTLLSLSYEYYKHQPMPLEQQRFPMDGQWKAGWTKNRAWIMEADVAQIKEELTKYVYEDQLPTLPANQTPVIQD